MLQVRFPIGFAALAMLALLGCLDSPKPEAPALKNVKDLSFKRICVIQGSVHEQYVSIKYPRAARASYEQIEDVFKAIETGACDGSLIGKSYANSNYLNSHQKIGILQDSVFIMDVAFALQKNNPKLLEHFNNYLIKLKVSGDLEQIINDWKNNPDGMPLPKNGDGSNGFLRVSTYAKDKPIAFLRDGQPAGYNIDIIFRFAEKMGLKASIVKADFSSAPTSLVVAGKADITADNVAITENLAKDVSFSIPHKSETSVAIAMLNNIQESKIHNLTILHTGNHSGTIYPKDGYGGLAERSAFFKQVRANHRNVILLDAGNLNGGNFISRYYNAMPDIKAYNAMEYDATVFGNHEFDNPIFTLRAQIDSSKFKWLGVNVRDNIGKGDHIGKPHTVKNIEGLRIGIIGVSSTNMKNTSTYARQVQWINEIAAVRRTVRQLKNLPKNEMANIIVLLANFSDAPSRGDYISAETLADSIPEINLIVQADMPEQLGSLKIRNNIPIVSAGANGKSVGMAQITVRNDTIISFAWNAMPIETGLYKPDPEVLKILTDYSTGIPEDFKNVVMTTTAKFNQFNASNEYLSCRQETAFGNLISDAMSWLGRNQRRHVDFAMINGNVIRTSLPMGNVTKGDLAEALPYDNTLKIVSMSGTEVAKLFDFVASIPLGNSGFPQVSKEVRYKITYTNANGKTTGKISDIRINNNPIDSSKIYNIVTTDFLLDGGDNYTIFKNNKGVYNTSMPVRNVVTEYVKTLEMPIAPTTDERIKVIELHALEGTQKKI